MKPCLYCLEFTDNHCACGAHQCPECAKPGEPCPICMRMYRYHLRLPLAERKHTRKLAAISTLKLSIFFSARTDPHATRKMTVV